MPIYIESTGTELADVYIFGARVPFWLSLALALILLGILRMA